ncbi:MAG: mechanosensitive ion channel family protein, partial [Oscillospiraceae bacterium]|nr:mechanosensitive ion channel family protein [Oscillospiraceae bacterium]
IINNSEISSLVNLSEVTSVAVVNVPVSYEDALEKSEAAVQEALSELPDEYPDIFKEAPFYKGVDVLAETHMELLVVANVAEENIYNARRIMQREIRFSCEKAGLTIPCREN